MNAINATLYDKLPFNFVNDIAPISGAVQFPNVMTVSGSFPATSVPEFIAYAKANPGKVNHGSSGNRRFKSTASSPPLLPHKRKCTEDRR